MKLHLPSVSLVVIDTTPKVHLAVRAIEKCLEQASFGAVKLLTDDESLPYAVKIPPIVGLGAYSDFCIKQLYNYVQTPHAIVAQADGYMLRGESWEDSFLDWDWIGSPWLPANINGNGGWSSRSRKLLKACAAIASRSNETCHPEDAWISMAHRKDLEAMGCRFAPIEVARRWGYEGRAFDSVEWQGIPNEYTNQLGFHSWLTKLPKRIDKPNIFHSSLDMGDLIYGTAVVKALGGGVIFISADNKYPYPMNSRWARNGGDVATVENLKSLLEVQPYIDRVQYTHGCPFSTSHDLNRFRLPWKERSARDNDSILKLHCDAFGVKWDETQPWLTVDEVWPVPGRPICVSRSARYQNPLFPWDKLVARYGEKMFFIGTAQEAHIFQGFGAPKLEIPWMPTANLLEAARYIAGAKVFMGNQSSPLAIAHGLCKNVVCEEWPNNPNCRLNRPNAIYSQLTHPEIPDNWLK